MSASETPDAQAVVTTGEARAIMRSIVGTGIGLATLLLMLAGLMVQQNAAVNTRIDDLNANMNSRFDDFNANMNTRFGSVNTRFDDANANVNTRFDHLGTTVNTRFDSVNTRFDDANANVNARFDDVNVRIDDLNVRIDGIVSDIRELRGLVIKAVKRADPDD